MYTLLRNKKRCVTYDAMIGSPFIYSEEIVNIYEYLRIIEKGNCYGS